MKKGLHVVRITIAGGIIFLLPLAFMIFLAKEAFRLFKPLLRPLLSSGRDITFFGVAVYQLIIILIILGICFIAGLLAQTKLARKLIGWMEEMVLDNIPAYRILKNKSQTIIGFEERKSEVVLVKIDDGWQLSFLIEKIGETSCTVFVPDVPDPYSGAVYVVDTKQIIKTAISAKQALICLRKFGLGAASLLANSKDQLASPNS